MRIKFALSQMKLPQQLLFIVFVQEPLLHISVVHEIPSRQSLSTVQLCSEAASELEDLMSVYTSLRNKEGVWQNVPVMYGATHVPKDAIWMYICYNDSYEMSLVQVADECARYPNTMYTYVGNTPWVLPPSSIGIIPIVNIRSIILIPYASKSRTDIICFSDRNKKGGGLDEALVYSM